MLVDVSYLFFFSDQVQSRIRVVVMAPKPKSRKVDALPAPAQSVSEIGNLNKKVASLVEDLHSRRFETADSKLEPLPWPLLHGGTLKEVAQRALSDQPRLLDGTWKFLCALGAQGDMESMDAYQAKFMTPTSKKS